MKITAAQAKAWGIDARGKAKAREPRAKPQPNRPNPPARLLALDPSSTAVGWACFEHGILRWVGVERSASADVQKRCAVLAGRIAEIAAKWPPDVVVVELFSGFHRKVERRRVNKAAILSLARAQGFLMGRLSADGIRAVPVPANKWTGSESKDKRAARVRLTQPVYAEWARKDGDKGLDGADAVGLGIAYLGGSIR